MAREVGDTRGGRLETEGQSKSEVRRNLELLGSREPVSGRQDQSILFEIVISR